MVLYVVGSTLGHAVLHSVLSSHREKLVYICPQSASQQPSKEKKEQPTLHGNVPEIFCR